MSTRPLPPAPSSAPTSQASSPRRARGAQPTPRPSATAPRSQPHGRSRWDTRPSQPDSGLLAAERRFLAWLADADKPDQVQLEDGTHLPLATLLGVLCASWRRLPPAAATTLGLSAESTIGEATAELVLAVKDPAGPRCRSYRAAVYYLHDLHGLMADLHEL